MSIRREDIKDMCTRAGLCARQYGRDYVPQVNSVSGNLEINLESRILDFAPLPWRRLYR